LLRPDATRTDIEQLCEQALEHEFAAVCVNGAWVSLCKERLCDTKVNVAAVVAFPLGAATSSAKAREAEELVDAGADELDVVAAIGHVLEGSWNYVEDDVRSVVESAAGRVVKVILETAALEPFEIVKGALLVKRAGARFVKTSTGFHPSGGASAEAVALLRLAVGDDVGVKASGGIRDCTSALRMLAAGATRIGTSSAIGLVRCLGLSTTPLRELVSDPERHAAVCETVRREYG
jgi:deoxyribose-phosphate aldolase